MEPPVARIVDVALRDGSSTTDEALQSWACRFDFHPVIITGAGGFSSDPVFPVCIQGKYAIYRLYLRVW